MEPDAVDMLEGKDEEQIDFLQKGKTNQVEANEIAKAAKKHSMNTDVKKAIFNAVISADDCLQAFESINSLGLKKVQEREVVRVLVQCCLTEKTYNPYYSLLA